VTAERPDTSDVIRAWIWNRDELHAHVAVAVGLGADEFSARMSGKCPWEADVVEDIRRTLGVPEELFWTPPTGQTKRSALAARTHMTAIASNSRTVAPYKARPTTHAPRRTS